MREGSARILSIAVVQSAIVGVRSEGSLRKQWIPRALRGSVRVKLGRRREGEEGGVRGEAKIGVERRMVRAKDTVYERFMVCWLLL